MQVLDAKTTSLGEALFVASIDANVRIPVTVNVKPRTAEVLQLEIQRAGDIITT